MQNFMAGFLKSAKGELIMTEFLYPMAHLDYPFLKRTRAVLGQTCRYQKLHFAQPYKDSPVSVHALSLSPQAGSRSSVNWLNVIAVRMREPQAARRS
jgi:hypothetical protein